MADIGELTAKLTVDTTEFYITVKKMSAALEALQAQLDGLKQAIARVEFPQIKG